MWKAAKSLRVSDEDRILLEEFLRSGNTPQKVAFRIRIVLEASHGKSNNELAQDLATTRVTVLKWRQRYLEKGVEGLLEDEPGRGRKRSIDAEKEAAIVKATLETKPKNATQWSTRLLACEQGVSDTTVLRHLLDLAGAEIRMQDVGDLDIVDAPIQQHQRLSLIHI